MKDLTGVPKDKAGKRNFRFSCHSIGIVFEFRSVAEMLTKFEKNFNEAWANCVLPDEGELGPEHLRIRQRLLGYEAQGGFSDGEFTLEEVTK